MGAFRGRTETDQDALVVLREADDCIAVPRRDFLDGPGARGGLPMAELAQQVAHDFMDFPDQRNTSPGMNPCALRQDQLRVAHLHEVDILSSQKRRQKAVAAVIDLWRQKIGREILAPNELRVGPAAMAVKHDRLYPCARKVPSGKVDALGGTLP